MSRIANDGGYPQDQQLHQMSDDGGPVGPDPARWADPVYRERIVGGGTHPRPPEPLPGPQTGTFSDPDFRG